ncbi:hypothetical protein [Acidiferrobacter thiooxydans]|jgi:hypothetical protein
MNTTDAIEVCVSEALPLCHIEAFLEQLRTAWYAEGTLRKKRWVLRALTRWMKDQNIALTHLDESAIAAFVKRLTGAPATRVRFELAVLRLLLAYLRGKAIVQVPAPDDESAIDQIYGRTSTICGKSAALPGILCSSMRPSSVIFCAVRMRAMARLSQARLMP